MKGKVIKEAGSNVQEGKTALTAQPQEKPFQGYVDSFF